MSLLEQIRTRHEQNKGTCKTCGNLTQVMPTLIGCVSHDKLIMPEYPPYHGNMKCPEWTDKTEEQQ